MKKKGKTTLLYGPEMPKRISQKKENNGTEREDIRTTALEWLLLVVLESRLHFCSWFL
jgi:hypothetical protein